MKARLSAMLATALVVVPATAGGLRAAAKSTFFEQFFLNAQSGSPCYARTYDAAHLKDHDKQTVRSIEIELSQENVSDIPNTPERFELGFGLKVRKSDDWFTGAAICSASGDDEANCFIEGDGGRFRLTAASDGAVKLETGDYGLALEGEKDFMSISGKDGDDRVFVLTPARAPNANRQRNTSSVPRPKTSRLPADNCLPPQDGLRLGA